MIVIAASAFGTFALFLLFGLLALPVTAALNKSIGKEKGLLIYAGLLLLLTFFMLVPAGPKKGKITVGKETTVPARHLVQKGDPFARAELDFEMDRNVFAPYSDTRDLPPVTLDQPPWIPMPIGLPPTVPGPAPAHRRVLRAQVPQLTKGDGSTIIEFPDAAFEEYTQKPEDVYDWMQTSSTPTYVYILAINDGTKWVREGEPAFEALKWVLAENGEGYEKMSVKVAYVGGAEQAGKYLSPLDVLKRRKTGVSNREVDDQTRWFLRRTVDNLYTEAVMSAFGRRDLPTDRIDPDKLRRVAKAMAVVGRTGKESREGWRRVVALIQRALVEIRKDRGAPERAEVLLELLEAQHALRDEQAVLRTLAEYMATAPNSAEAPTWLGDLHLRGMQLPREALLYYRDALKRDKRHAPALIGQGDALSYQGMHADALRSYDRAGGQQGQLRRAATELRLGQLKRARGTAESILAMDPSNQQAILIRACALYSSGDLTSARSSFEQVAAEPEAQQIRAQACYNLGLTCARQGQYDAALAAFDACQKALEQGSSAGPMPDEVVSPSLGRAFVAFCAGDEAAVSAFLDDARREAPRSSYIEMFRGMVASLAGDDAGAIRALGAALGRAPQYGELDGWLGKTYLRLGASAVATGASAKDSAETFERAVAFAARAANDEASADPKAYLARLRESLVRMGAKSLPHKDRYTLALGAAQKVLDNRMHRENAAALAITAYCYFQLGVYNEDNYDDCIRRFQDVLRIVPDQEDAEQKPWRDYSANALKAVKHWRSLEEKLVTFDSPTLARDMQRVEGNDVRVVIDEGRLHFTGQASKDGSADDATVAVYTKALFTKRSFESVTMRIWIPRTDASGRATNNIGFGVRVLGKGLRKGAGKAPGIGIFYDREKIAVRIGGGQKNKRYKDGSLLRLESGQAWPEGEYVVLRIEREDEGDGSIAIYLNDELIVSDTISSFKQSRGDATLWIGGYADEAQPFDVWVSDIRIVRKKPGK